jgi:hypothetical protein
MIITDIYGFEHADLEAARAAVESALGVRMQGHDSVYLGEYYRGSVASGAALQLRRNRDPMHDVERDPPEEASAEPQFAATPLLLYVSGLDAEALRETLLHRAAGIAFLQRRGTE